MGLLVKPPLTVRVTQQGLTEILPDLPEPTQRYRIYVIHLASAKSTRLLSLFEGVDKRWQGELKQDTSIRLDFGNIGWNFESNAGLYLQASGALQLDVNILQYLIITNG